MSPTSTPDATERPTLRDLSLPARLVLAAFLISVGIGYFSALVQLHFQQAPPGKPLPEFDDVVNTYSGQPPASMLERIITAPEHLPFTSGGSMRSAFTKRSVGWDNAIDKLARDRFARERFARDKLARETFAREKNAKFDDLPDEEKLKLLATFDELKEEERKKRLSAFDALPEEQRRKLLDAYDEQSEEDRNKFISLFDDLSEDEQKKYLAAAETVLRKERDGEVTILVHWIRNGLDKASFEKDAFALPKELKDMPIAERFVKKAENGEKTIRIQKILENRCVRCHNPGAPSAAADAPLDTYGGVKSYTTADTHGSGMGLRKLAQSTHVHLLGFSMLYGLTGLIFAFTSYPALIRFLLAPAALLAQVVDISFWWLARLPAPQGPMFAKSIIISGGIVGLSLAAQIVLSLFNLFGWLGRFVLVLAMLAALAGGYFANEHFVQKYLQDEKSAPVRVD